MKNEGQGMNDGHDTDDDSQGRQQDLADDVDAILDEIDEVVDESTERFIRSYVQKGGQGWSGFLDPAFYVGAAAAGVISGATYDAFKKAIGRIIKALRHTSGPSTPSPLEEDDTYNPHYEDMLRTAWSTGMRLAKQQGIEHSIDDATALHWVLFTTELQRSVGSIHLGSERYKRLARVSAADPEHLDPSQLATQIIDQWLEQKELHAQLRKAREEAGLTPEAVAEQLEWSLSKVIRIESGSVGPATRDLTALLRLYRVESPQRIGELVALSNARRQLGKPRL